jgi:ribosomal protein L6P/L9E
MKIEIKIDKYSEIKLYSLQNKLFLSFQQDNKTSFVEIPNSVTYELNNDILTLVGNTSHKDYFMSFGILKNLNKRLFGTQKRKVKLKGLGYKCLLSDDRKKLLLKVGNSHNTELKVPSYVNSFNILKHSVVFDSSDRILSGNYLHQIYLKKPADCYKRKGFTKENMKIKVRPVKKK